MEPLQQNARVIHQSHLLVTNQETHVKVLFEEDENVETLWAIPVGEHHYRLDNSPFLAYGVSWHDIVVAHRDDDGILRFANVHAKSGHRTFRLILEPPADKAPESQGILDQIVSLGATYEGAHPGFLSIDVGPDISIEPIVQLLTECGQQWEYADPPFEVLFPDDSACD